MSETVHAQIEKLVDIIHNFRNGELPFPIGCRHVERWLNQFDTAVTDVILQETVSIFSKWYFPIKQLNDYLQQVFIFIDDKYQGRFDAITFWNGQTQGASQTALINELKKHSPKTINADTTARKHVVYIDDGLYTGAKVRKEISEIIDSFHEVDTIDAFFCIAYSDGLTYTSEFLQKKAQEKGIELTLNRLKELDNEKQTDYSGVTESYHSQIGVLWPSRSLENEVEIQKFIKHLEDNGQRIPLKYRTHTDISSSIFSSDRNRDIVEREFIIEGLKILPKSSIDKGLYPLGFNVVPSFGFGSFCATDFNISNTCPVVLWWNASDKWYPLLPRRINAGDLYVNNQANWEE